MAILYNKIERNRPGESEGQRYWYPVVKSKRLVKGDEFAKMLAKEINVRPKVAEEIVYKAFTVATNVLLNGDTLQFGEFGSFRVTINTEPSDSEREVTSAKIKKINVLFTASEWLKNIMKEAKFLHTSAVVKKSK